MMRGRFYHDSETGLPHLIRHDVSEDEVVEVFSAPGEDRPGRDGSRVMIRQTGAGRHLRVIYVRDPNPDSFFEITAYELTGKPLHDHRRRQR
jgi:hypothetical protein